MHTASEACISAYDGLSYFVQVLFELLRFLNDDLLLLFSCDFLEAFLLNLASAIEPHHVALIAIVNLVNDEDDEGCDHCAGEAKSVF